MSRHPALVDDDFGEPNVRPEPPASLGGDPWVNHEHLQLVAGEQSGTLPRDRRPRRRLSVPLAGARARLSSSRAFREARFYGGMLAFTVLSTAIALTLMVVVSAAIPGWRAVFITSNSMEPAIQRGDVVIGVPVDEIEPGQVVVFEDPAGGGLITHRVVEVHADGRLLTAGDANGGSDSTPVDPGLVHGTGRFLVPYVGWPLIWLTDRAWLPAALLAVAVTLLARWSRYGLFNAYLPWGQRPSDAVAVMSARAEARR